MNRVLLIGRNVKDTDVRYNGDMAVAKTTLAIDRFGKERSTDFIGITAFGKTAVALEKVTKGQRVAVEGSIKTGSYLKQDGTKVYTTDVIVDKVEYLEKKEESSLPPKDSLPEFPQGEQQTVDDFFTPASTEGLPFN